MKTIEVFAVNGAEKQALCNDNKIYQIVKFIDGFGDDTDEIDLAKVAIIKIKNDAWLCCDLTAFESATIN